MVRTLKRRGALPVDLSGRWEGKALVHRKYKYFVYIGFYVLFHFCASPSRFVLGGRGTSLAKRRVDDHAPMAGLVPRPPSGPDHFRIDLEMK
jgi:hypothetical protein